MAYTRRQRKPSPPLWAFVAAPFGLFGVLFLVNLNNAEFRENSRRLTQTVQHTVQAEVETSFAEAERIRANARFQSPAGCHHVPAGIGGVREGMRFSLPENSLVCSENGTTGRIDANGFVVDLARTADQDVIREWGGW